MVTASTRGVRVVGADVDGDRDGEVHVAFTPFDVAPTSSARRTRRRPSRPAPSRWPPRRPRTLPPWRRLGMQRAAGLRWCRRQARGRLMTAAGGPTGLGRGAQLLELLERLLDLPLVLTDPGDLRRHLVVVGRFDLQPRPWVLALGRGVPSGCACGDATPGRPPLDGPAVPAGVPGDLVPQVGRLPRVAALAAGDVHGVSFLGGRRRGGSTVVSVAAVSRGGLLGGQGRVRLGAGGVAPLLRVGRSRRSPAGQCRGPRARKGRPQGVPKGREYRTERSEGGTDRPCRARGGTRLGGPDGTPFHPWPDTLPPTTSGRDSCGIQGSAGRGHRPGIRQGKEWTARLPS